MLRRYVVAGALALSLAALSGCGTGAPWSDPLDLGSGEGGFRFARDVTQGDFTGTALVGMPCTSGGRSVTVTGWDLPVEGSGASAELYVHSLPAEAGRTDEEVAPMGSAEGTAESTVEGLVGSGALAYEVRPLAVGDTFSVPCGKHVSTQRRDDLYLQITSGPGGARVAAVTVRYRDGWFEHEAVGQWETQVCGTSGIVERC